MKTQSNNLLERLDKADIKILTAEVKETICKDLRKEKKRIFSVAEYWDIQRRRRNILVKRMTF